MPDPTLYISQVTLPSGNTYKIKDAEARAAIAALGTPAKWIGITTTALTDGASTNPITINGQSVTAEAGNITAYDNGTETIEFIFDGSIWQKFGDLDLSGLGDLAYSDTASTTYTPAGSVSAPNISVSSAGSTESVAKAIVTAAPGATAPSNPVTTCSYDSTTETLSLYQVGYSQETVKTSDAAYSADAPSFTGTQATITVSGD